MSDAPGTGTPPLWSDNDIRAELTCVNNQLERARARERMYIMRDDYQQELASRDARIAELEKQLAERGEWEPVPDDIRAVIRSALTEYEYGRSAFYDGHPKAVADAALALRALAWLRGAKGEGEKDDDDERRPGGA